MKSIACFNSSQNFVIKALETSGSEKLLSMTSYELKIFNLEPNDYYQVDFLSHIFVTSSIILLDTNLNSSFQSQFIESLNNILFHPIKIIYYTTLNLSIFLLYLSQFMR